MTYIAFFCWFSNICLISLTLPHSFFSLWLIPFIFLYFSIWLCHFSTWGWIWWAQPPSVLSVWGVVYPTDGFRMAHFHQSRHLRKSAGGTSPSIWVLQKLLPSLNCTWLRTLGDFIFFVVDANQFPLIHSPPATHLLLLFSFILTGFLWEFHVCHWVCACMCLNSYFVNHCPCWSSHLFSLLFCASASFLSSLPLIFFFTFIGC